MSHDPDTKVSRIEIAPRTILYVLLALAAVWLLHALWNVVVVLLVSLMVVATVRPLVKRLEARGLGRRSAVALVYVSGCLVTIGLLLLALPPLVAQVIAMLERAPEAEAQVVARLSFSRAGAQIAQSIESIPVERLFSSAADRLLGFSSEAMTTIGYAVTTLFLSIYMTADSTRIEGALYALVPPNRHARTRLILSNLETIVGGYIRGQLITSAAITVFTWLLLVVCGVPDALPLAIFAGLTDMIPFVGGLLATIPSVLVALGVGTTTAIIVAVAMVAYQEFESRILVPRLYGRILRMSPALVLVALLTGGTLMGMMGALLALPVAAGLAMIVREVQVERSGDAAPAPPPPAP